MERLKIFNIRNNELIKSDCFVSEPVEKIINKIKDNSKTILAGPVKSGKTVTSLQFIREFQKKGEISLYSLIDSLDGYNIAESRDILEHFVELNICFDLYEMIKEYDINLYMNRFYAGYYVVKNELKTSVAYLNGERPKIDHVYQFGDVVIPMIEKLIKYTNLTGINLVLDRLDNHSPKLQSTYAKYFELFNKVLLSIGDKQVYIDETRRMNLTNKGYNIIDVDYGKNENVAKQIISQRIKSINNELNPVHPLKDIERIISEPALYEGIKKADGNIVLLLKAVRQIYERIILEEEYFHINTSFISDIESHLYTEDQIQKMYTKKLHL